MDETYIKVRWKGTYFSGAVDRDGQTLDSTMSECRDAAAVDRFFKCAVGTNGVPDRIAIDKCGANLAGLQRVNVILKFTEVSRIIEAFNPSLSSTLLNIPLVVCTQTPSGQWGITSSSGARGPRSIIVSKVDRFSPTRKFCGRTFRERVCCCSSADGPKSGKISGLMGDATIYAVGPNRANGSAGFDDSVRLLK